MEGKKYSIVPADDHVLIRHGIKNIIRQGDGYEVVGEVKNGEELLHLLNKRPVDLVIMDITMPDMNGIEATETVKRRYPRTKVLILSMHKSKEHFSQSMSAGADGYLVKDDSDSELLVAVEQIRCGKMYLDPYFGENLSDDLIESCRDGANLVKKVSRREKEVLQLVVDGLSSREIAKKLNLSPRTVDTHRSNLLKKFNLNKSVDL